MNRNQSKRTQLIKRTLIYMFMSLSVVVIVGVLMLLVLGYSFNQKDNRIEQGGLLQFASEPSGATVTLDGVTLGSRTPSKVTAEATNHTVTMSLDGYRTWQKSINLKAGMVGWLSYARLIPTDVKTEKLRTTTALAGVLASPDDKWMALLDDATKPAVVVADLQNDNVKYKTLDLPATSFTQPEAGKSQTFTLDSWSQNGQYILVKHTYDDSKVEWIVIDRNDVSKTKNITTTLAISADKVVFAADNGKSVYVKTGDIVRKVDLDSETLSRPLVSNVDDFWVYHFSTLLYATRADPTTKLRSVGYMADNMDNGQTLATYPDDGLSLKIATSEYFNERYVAISHGADVVISQGSLPNGTDKGSLKTIKKFTMAAPIQWLDTSTNGRFVIAQTGATFTTYDLELAKSDTTILKGVAPATSREQRWLDPFMTWSDNDGTLRLYEFDGANQQDITAVAPGYDATYSPNEKYLYYIAHDAEGYSLARAHLVIN
jgi:hypothetical protein